LAILLGSQIGAVCVGFAMAYAVDAGIYRVVSSSVAFRTSWVTVMMTLLLGGIVGFFAAMLWFTNGKPSRQLFPPKEDALDPIPAGSPAPH
jgi:hypothetical protein